ncbi:MAG: PAS domain-containing protein, partial [Sphingomicrobium sp.]
MLHKTLAPLDARLLDEPLTSGRRWLVPALVAAAAASGALLFWTIGATQFAWLFFAGFVAMLVAAFVLERRSARTPELQQVAVPDLALLGTALALHDEPVALTDGEGQVLVANPAYRDRFPGARSPRDLAPGLAEVQISARRDGHASGSVGEDASVQVERAGARGDLLLWRFPHPPEPDALTTGARQIAGATGERFAAAGVLAVLVDDRGLLVAANKPFADRAIGPEQPAEAPSFSKLVELSLDGQALLIAEGEQGLPMRAVHVPLDPGRDGGPGTWLLFGGQAEQGGSGANIQALLDVLPVGLALVDRDGRFLTANKAFHTAGGVKGGLPAYPGDLVVKEDKAAVADAVRRNARGPAMSGDLAVRLAHQAGEPVALTVAGLRGLGDAAVLLLLKDNSEEAKLKRQVAQATKMQAVGQLAGGVAHDFNNILTAIIGHCDLMLMRHTPGDSDYDDIQQ